MNSKIYTVLVVAVVTIVACAKKQAVAPSADTPTINGVTYPTTKIGSQLWTTVNYNGPGGVNYGNSQTNSVTYGKLYTFAEAQAVSLPAGWRVPSFTDWNKLIISLGGTGVNNIGKSNLSKNAIQSLMATDSWRNGSGSNTASFKAYPAGVCSDVNRPTLPEFIDQGYVAVFKGSTQYLNSQNVNFYIRQDSTNYDLSAGLGTYLLHDKSRASLRFVKDN